MFMDMSMMLIRFVNIVDDLPSRKITPLRQEKNTWFTKLSGLLVVVVLMSVVGYLAHQAFVTKSANSVVPNLQELPSVTSQAKLSQVVIPTVDAPQPIAESDIVSLAIPAAGINALASGPTWPRPSPHCHGGSACIDPEYLDKVAWYGAYSVPAVPSTDTVLVFGHSNPGDDTWQTFNNLHMVETGNPVIITTKTGTFTYRAQRPFLVPFDQVPFMEVIFAHVPNRLVMATCGDDTNAVVVIADLESAALR